MYLTSIVVIVNSFNPVNSNREIKIKGDCIDQYRSSIYLKVLFTSQSLYNVYAYQ